MPAGGPISIPATRSKTAISPKAAVPGVSSKYFRDLEEGGFRGLCYVPGRSDGGMWFVVVLKWVGDGFSSWCEDFRTWPFVARREDRDGCWVKDMPFQQV